MQRWAGIGATIAVSFVMLVAGHPAAHAGEPVRLNQIQAMGTHNSYRFEAPWPISLVPALNYSHAPLDLQLGFEGARKVEIDLYSDHASGPFSVKHIPFIDQRSSCAELTACLTVLKTWSDAHPSHAPVFVHIEPKDDLSPVKVSTRYDDLDATIRSVMAAGDLITPDDVRGPHTSVAEALAVDGWPAIDDARGRFLFYLDVGPGPTTDRYLDGHPELEGRVAFPAGQDGASWAGVFVVNDPVAQFDRIRALVSAGYIVRTRAELMARWSQARRKRLSTRARRSSRPTSPRPATPTGARTRSRSPEAHRNAATRSWRHPAARRRPSSRGCGLSTPRRCR